MRRVVNPRLESRQATNPLATGVKGPIIIGHR